MLQQRCPSYNSLFYSVKLEGAYLIHNNNLQYNFLIHKGNQILGIS